MATMEQHPLALQYAPGIMSEEEFAALKADIAKHGQRLEITTYEGKILDGMHRYRACIDLGKTPNVKPYTGKNAEDVVISLNVHRKKLGATQRAVVGANLNLEHGISQDEASKRVGVSKLHISIASQIMKSKNARMIKMLEKPDVTREQLYEEAVDAGIMQGAARKSLAVSDSAPHAASGVEAFFRGEAIEGSDEDDLIGDGAAESDPDLDGILGDAPSAGGRVIGKKEGATAGGVPVVGTRPKHPERRAVETPASKLSSAFRGLTQTDQVDFVKFCWNTLSKAILAAGVVMPADPAIAAVATSKAIGKAKASAKAATSAAKPASKGKATAKAK